ncbi:MAG: glycosyltransferase family 4 protein [Candidatus Omnitrophica bacterium]|nr:glycosyltransferase family 4 protein [Candidatus Omnitrophota bacterium]
MKIVHVNRTDLDGGAAVAAFRLHQSLLEAGCDSRILVDYKKSSLETVQALYPPASLGLRLINVVESITSLQYLFPRPAGFLRHPAVQNADVINFHNLHGGYFSPWLLPEITKHKSVVWTLHDMWPVTGHCGYSFECDRWLTGCGHCPLLKEYPALSFDLTAMLWKIKYSIYQNSSLNLVAPSHWLADIAKRSPLLGSFPIHHIPYGVSVNDFRPIDKAKAREQLGIPRDRKIILFGAAFTYEKRKGASYLIEALEKLSGGNNVDFDIASFGLESEKIKFPAQLKHWPFGIVQNQERMAAIYSAADVFVVPTLADNLPNTILESMACGTPVVAFGAGGVSDAVKPMQTGYLARYKNAEDLSVGIKTILGDDSLRLKLAAECRKTAERYYSLELQRKRYVSLYEDLIKKRREKKHAQAAV